MHQENGGLFDQKERYSYENYLSQIEGARLNVIPKRPEIEYVRAYDPKQNSPYTMTRAMAESFMQDMKTAKKRPAPQSRTSRRRIFWHGFNSKILILQVLMKG